jgi:hypothetical protein
VALCALGLSAAPGAADSGGGGSFHCNQTVNGGTISGNVVVSNNGTCILNGVTVAGGNVSINRNGYFEANGSNIEGNITANQALTVYIWGGSNVSGNVAGYSAQVFVYNSTVGKSVGFIGNVAPGYGHFQVCGSTVTREIGFDAVGPDVLVGDPANGCEGNTVKNGDIVVANNPTDSELYVIGNTTLNGDIGVYLNSGVGPGQVNGNNAPNGDLFCLGNTNASFDGTHNGSVGDVPAGTQCSADHLTGVDPDEG